MQDWHLTGWACGIFTVPLIELHSNYSAYLHLTLHIALDMLIPRLHAVRISSKV